MKSKVVISQVKDLNINEALHNLLDNLGGLGRYVKKGDKVFIKPNMFLAEDPETGLTTHPALVVALAKMCYEIGAKVIVGERNGNIKEDFYDYKDIYNYAEVVDLDKEDVILKVPDKDNYVITFPIPFPRVIDEAEVVINMPGLRTHVLTWMSNALKNLMGFLPGTVTFLVHLSGLEEAIVDLNRMINVDLNISDAIYSLQGSFPANQGSPVKSNFIMGSVDPVALDTIATDILGYEIKDVDTIKLATRAGLGTSDLNEIEIIGEVEYLKRNYKFKKPKGAEAIKELEDQFDLYYDNACDKCVKALVNGIYAFKEENDKVEIEKAKEVSIITGNSYQGSPSEGKNLLYGNCAKIYSQCGIYVPGCPPLTGVVKSQLKELIKDK